MNIYYYICADFIKQLKTLSPDGSSVYVVDRSNKNIYQIPSTGPFPFNVTAPPESAIVTGLSTPTDVAISPDGLTGYIADKGSRSILTFPTSGSIPRPTTTVVNNLKSSSSVYFITLSPDGNTLLLSNIRRNTIYSFPANGPFPIDATGQPPIVTFTGAPINSLAGMTYSLDGSSVYVTDVAHGRVYSFPANTTSLDLATTTPMITGLPIDGPISIQFSTDGSELLIANYTQATIYSIPADGPFPYVASTANLIVTLPNGGIAYAIATFRPYYIATATLKGNSLRLAKYLNKNAKFSARFPFLYLQGRELSKALEAVAPTRNALATFASQTGQITLSRALSSHTAKSRWSRSTPSSSAISIGGEVNDSGSFLADADDQNVMAKKSPASDKKTQVWVSGFGEYAHLRPGPQTPYYTAGSGGVVAAADYSAVTGRPMGAGAAYAHTHLHEADGAGHADINQGDLFVYSLFKAGTWYFDTALWGGYYHSHNVRKISFTNYTGGNATSKILGWQLAPHLEVGYDHSFGWVGIEPFIMADYVATWEHGAKESGSTLYNFYQRGRYCSLFRTESGLKTQQYLHFNVGALTFMEKMSYAYQKAFHTGSLSAFLVGAPGSFTVTTLQAAQNMGVAEFEILFTPKKNLFSTSLNLHTELGSRYQSYQGTIELSKSF